MSKNRVMHIDTQKRVLAFKENDEKFNASQDHLLSHS